LTAAPPRSITSAIPIVGPCDAGPDGTDRGITINSSHVEYDTNNRVTTVTDVNTNSTTYAYDTRNRRVLETSPDGTAHTFQWNVLSSLAGEVDASGTAIVYSYDELKRLIRKDITPGSNVVASTTFETFVYDGLSRCVAASNDVSGTWVEYDSLGNQTRCVQDGVAVLSTRNALGERTSLTYPSGLTASYTYDLLHQVKTVSMVSNGQTSEILATYDYAGPGRLAHMTRLDGTTSDILWDGLVSQSNLPGDYGWQSIAGISHKGVEGATVIDERIFSYDRSQNKILRTQTEPFDPATPTTTTNTWEYDALCRQRAAVTMGDVVINRSYVLDGKGNRIAVTNNAVTEFYVRSATVPPSDFQMDQYTETPSSGLQAYDENGRLTDYNYSIAQLSSRYDYADRLVQVDAMGATGSFEPLVSFDYDAFGRRISKTVYASGVDPETTQYVCDGVDEDCDGIADDDNILETYIGDTLADVRIYGGDGGMFSPPIVIWNVAGAPLFTRCDDLGNVLALTDSNGTVLERYEYSDFGEPQFLAADGSLLTGPDRKPATSSLAGNPYLFHGMQWDNEIGLYLDTDQGRYVDPRSGQYTTRSDSGVGGEQHSRAFSDNNPWTVGGNNTRAQDHNSTRSNRGGVSLAGGGGGGGSDTRATDHNSSRSNKTSHNRVSGGGGGGGGSGGSGGNSTRATDHNSSRSNKTSHNRVSGGGGGGSGGSGTRAQDYNSSRCNRRGISIGPGGGGDDRILRKRPGRVTYGNITLSRGAASKNVAKFKAGAALAKAVN